MIQVPESGDSSHEMWTELFELERSCGVAWTLIGAHMVALHGWANGRDQIRPSRDADVLVDARALTGATAKVSSFLSDREFVLDGASPDGVGHRFTHGAVSVDVLGPDGVGEKADLTTLGDAHTVRVPGGTQALRRSSSVEVRSRDVSGLIPLPDLLGSLLVKVRAISVGRTPDAQREDVAFLLSLILDPDAVASDITPKERGWLKGHDGFGDPSSACYRRIPGAEDAAIVFRRLRAAE